jgi:DNA-binding PadR family transcriptional regulator
MHGYEIVVTLNRDPESSFNYRFGTLYPILRSLEQRRYLKSYEIKKNGKRRIYYRCTRKQGGDNDES